MRNKIINALLMRACACMIAATVVASCAEPQITKESIVVDPYVTMRASDFVESCKEIRLSKSDSCVLSKIDALKIYDDDLLILDNGQLYLFGKDGNFVSRIGRRGKGHGEYISVEDFDMVGNNIIVLSRYQNALLEYSKEGVFIKKHLLDDAYAKFYVIDEHHVILASHSCNDTHANFVWYDISDDKKQESSGRFEKNQSMLFGDFNAFIGRDEQLLVAAPFDYTIYSLPISGGEMREFMSFDFKTKVKIPGDISDKDFFKLYESTMNKNVVKYMVGYVSKKGRSYLAYPLFDEVGGINVCITRINDDGSNKTCKIGMEIDKKYRYFSMGEYKGLAGDRIIMTCPADVILKREKERGLSHFTKSGLKRGDNPVVFVYRLK